MNRKVMWLGIGMAALLVTGCGTATSVSKPSDVTTGISSHPASSREVTGVNVLPSPHAVLGSETWHGLSTVPSSMLQVLETARVETASGQTVVLPLDRPVIVFAPWCKYCHELAQTLKQEGLLNQATWVAAGFERYEYPMTQNGTMLQLPMPFTLAEAQQKVQQAFAALGVPMPERVLYAMPGTALANAIRGFPDVFVPHDGRWYLQPGYVENTTFWRAILG
ncbi:hypothetical protein [Alicyclobacillus fructus]|uniref:hypothetical protein n=1 Tax=Alicyclobacillus fructus TaxID=2816082 RepID=UPI001A8F3F40|nr:hypothetical protein [Alicyclobacillus fructus]